MIYSFNLFCCLGSGHNCEKISDKQFFGCICDILLQERKYYYKQFQSQFWQFWTLTCLCSLFGRLGIISYMIVFVFIVNIFLILTKLVPNQNMLDILNTTFCEQVQIFRSIVYTHTRTFLCFNLFDFCFYGFWSILTKKSIIWKCTWLSSEKVFNNIAAAELMKTRWIVLLKILWLFWLLVFWLLPSSLSLASHQYTVLTILLKKR